MMQKDPPGITSFLRRRGFLAADSPDPSGTAPFKVIASSPALPSSYYSNAKDEVDRHQQHRRRRQSWRFRRVLAYLYILVLVCCYFMFAATKTYNSVMRRSLLMVFSTTTTTRRQLVVNGGLGGDEATMHVAVVLPKVLIQKHVSVVIDRAPSIRLPGARMPYFNEVNIENLHGLGAARAIDPHDYDRYEQDRAAFLIGNDVVKMDDYYLNEADLVGSLTSSSPPETVYKCRRNNWRTRKYQNCNNFHEQTLARIQDGIFQSFNVTYRGRGSFRVSWSFQQQHQQTVGGDRGAEFIWKAMRWGNPFDYKYFHQMNNEAIIMERLTGSPRVVDIYGFCGCTIFAENMVSEVTKEVVPGSEIDYSHYGYIEQGELDIMQVLDVHPLNTLSNEQKLDYAIVMAESIADIHGYDGGVIVHGDIHTVQWLKNARGEIKLNDFNNGEILNFDPMTNEYCEEYRCYGGTFRPPEELACHDLDSNEQVDTWPMGNTVYCLLTGLWPYYQYGNKQDRRVIRHITRDCETPYVDDRYRNRSLIEGGLVRIMEQTWECNYKKRISIFEVVQQLYQLREEYHKSKK